MIGALFRRVVRVLRAQSSWSTFRDYVSVHATALVDASAAVNVLNPPADAVELLRIGEGSHVFCTFSILRPEARIRVGARCQLGSSHLASAAAIDVGDDVIMSWGVTVLDSDNHSPYWAERNGDVERGRRGYVETGGRDIARHHDWSRVGMAPIRIGNKAFIGCNVIILKGVTVGEGAIVGAGSVVTHDIKPWHVAAGNPCRELRAIEPARPT
ncbi:MAG TPA: acyltransferase [Burkholderiales bacterium]|nr:acyltransferase [Burkholderiales bacterium]